MSLLTDYQRDGYLICRDLVDAATVAASREEAVAIACGRRGAIDGVTPCEHDDVAALKDVLAVHFPHELSPPMRAFVMICGQDAKTERGLEDLARPYLRPDSATR